MASKYRRNDYDNSKARYWKGIPPLWLALMLSVPLWSILCIALIALSAYNTH